MYFTYVIQNQEGLLYKGHTNNLERRIREHNLPNSQYSCYIKNKGEWKLVHYEIFKTRQIYFFNIINLAVIVV